LKNKYNQATAAAIVAPASQLMSFAFAITVNAAKSYRT
jgi:hypothetical protein